MAARKRKGRPRMGRPPKPPEEKRRNRLMVSLTDAELAAVERLADEREVPLGQVLYDFVRRGLRGKVR